MRSPVQNHLEVLKALLDEGMTTSNVELLRDCDAGLSGILDALGRMPSAERAALIQAEAHLLEVRGRCRAARFELDGDLESLAHGIVDFRKSSDLLSEPALSAFRSEVQANLATALVRYGEQAQRTGEFREAVELIDPLLAWSDPDNIPTALRNLFNARCVAELGLGAATGDRGLVKKAARDLNRLLRNPNLDKSLENRVEKNLIAAFFENAVLSRNERLHRELIGLLRRMVDPKDADWPYFLHYLARTRQELSRIEPGIDLLRGAITDLELLIPFVRGASRTGELPSALQTLADTYCDLGKLDLENSCAHFRKAVSLIDEVVALSPPNALGSAEDARVTRLLADSGACRFMLGRAMDDPSLVEHALREYRSALDRVIPETSPRMYFRVSVGMFEAGFLLGRWREALDSFHCVERAWEISGLDRLLSSEVHDQRITDMAGRYSKAAYCHLMLGQTACAVEMVERGRAQEMKMAASGLGKDLSTLAPTSRASLDEATSGWEKDRRDSSVEVCREAWRNYINFQQAAGLYAKPPALSYATIMDRIPCGGALVYFVGTGRELNGLVLIQGEPVPRTIDYPQEALTEVSRFIYGNKAENVAGWATAYQAYRDGTGDDGDRLFDWNSMVAEGMRTLGLHLIEPVHCLLKKAGLASGSPVLLSPTGDIAALPLPHAELADGSSFGEHWSISLVPSAFFVAGRPEHEHSAIHRHLIISDSVDVAEPTAGLPYAAREASMVNEHFRNGSGQWLKGNKATVGAVIDSLPMASIVHVACHGSYDWAFPANSGIHLPCAAKLEMSRLRQSSKWRLDCRLVFLSCCESGISGKTIPPDEFVGILTSFLACGAKAAIGALWPVYDDAAMVLCSKFYQLYLDESGIEKMPPATALSKAQTWLRQVRLQDLVNEGYFGMEEALDLVNARFLNVRLRGILRQMDQRVTKGAPPTMSEWSETTGNTRLYESPVDWAAFVLVGV
jgi:CHAT domain-containing protein/tetratricopeptide (TPR) repeat protein